MSKQKESVILGIEHLCSDHSTSNRFVMIDYDDTITRSKEMFFKLIIELRNYAFSPIICTSRSGTSPEDEEVRQFADEAQMAIIFCDGEEKSRAIKKAGIHPSMVAFWIDDMPISIPDRDEIKETLEVSENWK